MGVSRNRYVLGLLLALLATGLLSASGCRQSDMKQSRSSGSVEMDSRSMEPSRVTIEQIQRWMDEGRALTFLDSRSEASWRTARTKVPGSIRVPPYEVEQHLDEIPRDRTIIAYCT